MTGRIHSTESFGTVDGPGIRFIVFFQGCPLRCRYCHNPDTWAPGAGRRASAGELMREIESCRNFICDGGVTLSGGEPLLQPEFALALLRECRAAGFHTAVDTAGSLPLDKTRAVIDAADLLLLDIKALDPGLCRRLTGQGPENTLATLDYCEKTGRPVWIRHVIVPGWTLEPGLLRALARFLKGYACVERADLLPFHKMGEHKWGACGMEPPLASVPAVTPEQLAEARRVFEEAAG